MLLILSIPKISPTVDRSLAQPPLATAGFTSRVTAYISPFPAQTHNRRVLYATNPKSRQKGMDGLATSSLPHCSAAAAVASSASTAISIIRITASSSPFLPISCIAIGTSL